MANQSIWVSAITPLRKYFDFSGRAGRREFWAYFFLCLILEIALIYTDIYYGLYSSTKEIGILSGVFSFATFIPFIAVAVRRFHDIGKSGMHLLWVLIPFLGVIALFAFWLRRGQPIGNQYGAQPT